MNSIKDILPEELSKTLISPQFDDEAGLLIESVIFTEEDDILTFSIRLDEDEPQETWEVIISGLEEEQIIRNWSQTIEVYKEHILLLEYHDIYTELYFKGVATNSETLFIDIFQSLTQLSDNRADVAKYILSPEIIRKLGVQGYGLFARGPKTILRVYEQCLVRQGIKPIFIGEIEPSNENKSLKLLKLGDSYFIGKNFLFERKQ
jgi:hypothetical protein